MTSSLPVIVRVFSKPGRVAAQMPGNPAHQLVDGLATVIARDVGVHLPPEPLDVVVLRTVGRQEVQLEQGAVLRHVCTSCRPTVLSTTTSSGSGRSEEHTSELQSPYELVCRLLLEK